MDGTASEPSEQGNRELPLYDENGVDLALVRAFLKLSPTERIARLQDLADFLEQVREGAARKNVP